MSDDIDFSGIGDGSGGDGDVVTTLDATSYGDDTVLSLETSDSDDDLYESDDGEQSADDIDPRRLFRTPTWDEVRWYYRHTLGGIVVNKPILDAYKNGYEVKNDPAKSVRPFLERYLPHKITAEIKGRRDGWAAVLFHLRDGSEIYEPPSDVKRINKFEVLTLDDTTDSGVPHDRITRGTGFPKKSYEVTDTGLVIVDDRSSLRHEELLGYVVDTGVTDSEAQFVHANRCQHFSWSEYNDGPVDERTFGQHEGDSVLLRILNELKSLAKLNWAIGQVAFRYSAPLYVVETPETWGEDDFDEFAPEVQGLNAASDATMPPGTTLEVEGVDGEFDPQPMSDVLVEQMCSGTEMTKSVLMGTQTGTVSGSSTDIKNYFNQVQRYRQNRAVEKIDEAVRMVSSWNKSIIPTFSLGFNIEWGPLFKVDQVDKMEAAVRVTTAVTNGVNNYILSLQEARDIAEMAWADIDLDVELGDDLTEEELDQLDRVNQHQMGTQYGSAEEREVDGNPRRGQNGGGMSQGQTTDPNNPSN